jgi:putative phosphoribosyl transferase
VTFVDREIVAALGLGDTELGEAAERAGAAVRDQAHAYRWAGAQPSIGGRTAVVVDDGLATGATARAALRAAHRMGAARVVLAVPVGARESLRALRREADDIVCLKAPRALVAVGPWYDDFDQVPTRRVLELLREDV